MAAPLAFRAGIITYGVLGSLFCTWASCKVTGFVHSLLYPSNSTNEPSVEPTFSSKPSNSAQNDSAATLPARRTRAITDASPRRRRSSNSNRQVPTIVMISTLISSWLFTLTIVSAVSLTLTIFTILGWHSGINSSQDSARQRPECHIQAALNLILNYIGYGSMLVVCLERLQGILDRTRFQLSERTLRVCRGAVGLAISLMIGALGAWAAQRRVLAGLIALPISVIYPSLSLWIAMKYVWTTRRIAEELESSEWANRMIHASLRLTIVSTAAVTSTMLSYLSFLIYLVIGEPEWMRHVFQMIYVSDPIWNCFCLLCTFSGSVREYQFVFGRLHCYFIARLRTANHRNTTSI